MAKGEKRKITLINSVGSKIGLEVELADNLTTRAKGLMGREAIGEYEGMLFVFDKPDYYGFWMFNTTIPLDALYISENGTVVDIIQMDPCGLNITACKTHNPKEKAKFVLEVNQGFSEKHAIDINNSRMLTD